jgi:hypothetical protein
VRRARIAGRHLRLHQRQSDASKRCETLTRAERCRHGYSDPAGNRRAARQAHHRPGRGQACGGDRAAQPLASQRRSTTALRNEITPKNILMIGPTGVGKTEIARRLARLAGAPFIKVEATKFTEVGYVGRDVESIIRDLADVAVNMAREQRWSRCAPRPRRPPRSAFSTCCCPGRAASGERVGPQRRIGHPPEVFARCCARASSRTRRSRSTSASPAVGVEIMAPPGMEEMTNQLQRMFQNIRQPHAQPPLRIKQAQAADRGRGREAHQRRRRARAALRTSSRTASCSSTRSTRWPSAGGFRGGCLARRRAA